MVIGSAKSIYSTFQQLKFQTSLRMYSIHLQYLIRQRPTEWSVAFRNTKYHTWSFTTGALIQSKITLSGMAQNVDTSRMDKMRIHVLSV